MPSTNLRQTRLREAKSLVVKVGTQALTAPDGSLDTQRILALGDQLALLMQQGRRVTLVSSGAIGSGMAALQLTQRPKHVEHLQAVASIGQPRLMMLWHAALIRHGVEVGQLLLTRSDFDDRTRYLNLRHTLTRLHELGALPVINENDCVAVEELTFGDNDQLAALTAAALGAQVLVILSVVDGLQDAHGQRVDLVESLDDATTLVRSDRSRLGTGGMATKLDSVRTVTEAGELAVIASGHTPGVLTRLFDGEPGIGTLFAPRARRLDQRRRWIGWSKRPAGTLRIDAGAARAVVEQGKSLLAKGVTACEGQFTQGAVVSVRDEAGEEVARGLCNFDADDLRKVMGQHSADIQKLLGKPTFAEVIHRDHLVVTRRL